MVTILNNKRWYYSLRWKLFTIYFFVSFIPLLFFSNIATQTIEKYFQDIEEAALLSNANILSGSISKANYLVDESQRPKFDNYITSKHIEDSYRIIVIDTKGVVVNDSISREIGKTFLVPELILALKGEDSTNLYREEDRVYAAVPILDSNSVIIGSVLLVSSFQHIRDLLIDIKNLLFLITTVTGIIMTVLVFFISQLIIEPLKNILKVVQKISDGHLDQRIFVTGHDEFSELGYAFNNMSEKLEQVEITRQEFVSNVSHELKTPLSSIKVLSDSIIAQGNAPIDMYQEFLQDISSEVDRMTHIINDLLSLVKLDQKESALNIKDTDLNKLAEDILKRLYPLAEQKSIELLYEDVRKISIQADEMKLTLAISNLVENAIKYTDENGTVKVTVDSDHRNAFITVQDTGIGINEEEQSKVFTRFYRVDKTRNRETGGTGLGLSITLSTVLLHQGSIRLASKENVGSTFTVRLPINQTTQ